MTPSRAALLLTPLLALVLVPLRAAEPAGWKPEAAAKYLDERANAWLKYRSAGRGDGDSRTTCITCHTTFAYMIARPALRAVTREAATPQEQQILANVRRRTLNWDKLDDRAWGHLYAFDEEKVRESRGTEAVLNAYLLALDDRAAGKKEPSEATRKAFANLWAEQLTAGERKGSWEWLQFRLEPWESPGSRYYGAAIAALAVGTAPGYQAPAEPLAALRSYLRDHLATQPLYQRVWVLRAASALPDVLTEARRKEVLEAVAKAQHADGGWSLAELGGFVRTDGSEAVKTSDGYATGLIVHTLLQGGAKPDDAVVAKGIAWLKANQQDSGGWPGHSPNRDRDPQSYAWWFLPTSATAYASLALAAVSGR